MKKIRLVMVFVFATGINFLNANTTTKDEFNDVCFEQADRQTTKLAIRLNLTLEKEFETFETLYDDCVGN